MSCSKVNITQQQQPLMYIHECMHQPLALLAHPKQYHVMSGFLIENRFLPTPVGGKLEFITCIYVEHVDVGFEPYGIWQTLDKV